MALKPEETSAEHATQLYSLVDSSAGLFVDVVEELGRLKGDDIGSEELELIKHIEQNIKKANEAFTYAFQKMDKPRFMGDIEPGENGIAQFQNPETVRELVEGAEEKIQEANEYVQTAYDLIQTSDKFFKVEVIGVHNTLESALFQLSEESDSMKEHAEEMVEKL